LIVDQEFDGPLDLIIDDSSHLMPQSRESFCALFPKLRPGGAYIVEDWSFAHRMDTTYLDADSEGHARDKAKATKPTDAAAVAAWNQRLMGTAPLSLLLFELAIACAHVPGLIERIEIGPDLFTVRRGSSPVNSDRFQLSGFLDERARSLVPRLGA
jgi:hypothetical protein